MQWIDFSYIINLTREYGKICEKFGKITERAGDIPFFVMTAVNGKKLVSGEESVPFEWGVYQNWKIKGSDNLWWNRDVKPGEAGCGISHYWAWKDAYFNQKGNVLFLEEDFVLLDWPTEEEWKAIPEDWDIIYLARNLVPGFEDERVNEYIVRPGYSYNLHAYILSSEGQRKVLQTPFVHNIFPVDEFIPAVCGTHSRKDLQNFHIENFNAYAFNQKNFIIQESNSLTSQTENIVNIRDTRDWGEWCKNYINPAIINHEYELVVDEILPHANILEFPLFTKKFCEELIQLAEMGEWQTKRHFYYPAVDMAIDSIGMGEIYGRVINEFVKPLANWYWELGGPGWDNVFHETFIIKYQSNTQGHLSLHHDHSSYTIGVKLNEDFEGGGTTFPSYGLTLTPKRVGNAFLHPGLITHRHGARPTYEGTRYIAVSFIRNPDFFK